MERDWKNGDSVVRAECAQGGTCAVKYPAEVVAVLDRGDLSGPRVIVMDDVGNVDWEYASVYRPAPRSREDIVQEAVEDYEAVCCHRDGSFCSNDGDIDEEYKPILAAIIDAAIEADRAERA